MPASGLDDALAKLRADGAGAATIAAFEHAARQFAAGERGVLAEIEIEPVEHARGRGGPARAGRRRPATCSTAPWC